MTKWLVPTAFPSALSVTFAEGCSPHGYQINHALMPVLHIFSNPPPFFFPPCLLSQDTVKYLPELSFKTEDAGHAPSGLFNLNKTFTRPRGWRCPRQHAGRREQGA
ncbi:hypothetical protein BC826DRAFT_1025168 [Russula brevipes]|nr:hypothetical protein BC826DRAFT_1025168 [Russula brevipes]